MPIAAAKCYSCRVIAYLGHPLLSLLKYDLLTLFDWQNQWTWGAKESSLPVAPEFWVQRAPFFWSVKLLDQFTRCGPGVNALMSITLVATSSIAGVGIGPPFQQQWYPHTKRQRIVAAFSCRNLYLEFSHWSACTYSDSWNFNSVLLQSLGLCIYAHEFHASLCANSDM